MTKDEALKLALEALQNPWKAGPDGVADAIIAIKETLAQRTWVGLTDAEVKKIVGSDRYTDLLLEVVNFVEAKLKEKNT